MQIGKHILSFSFQIEIGLKQRCATSSHYSILLLNFYWKSTRCYLEIEINDILADVDDVRLIGVARDAIQRSKIFKAFKNICVKAKKEKCYTNVSIVEFQSYYTIRSRVRFSALPQF